MIKRLSFLSALLLLGALALFGQNVLIIYDGAKTQSEAFKSARFIQNLLGHFHIAKKQLLPVNDYLPGEVEKWDVVFMIFEEGHPTFADAFLDDLINTRKELVWINMHLDRLLDRQPGKWGISQPDFEYRRDWKIYYRDEEFPKTDPGLNLVTIQDQQNVRIVSPIVDLSGRRFPYVLKSDNLWYFADSPFSYTMEGGRFLILADLMHDILGQDHPGAPRRALVRIEDVHPESDPATLTEIADYLHRQDIPFQISLIPVYKETAGQQEVRLSERPELVAALQRAQSQGATVVLHGVTHQHFGESADDYEFWDDVSGKPIEYGAADWVAQRLQTGLGELFANRLYPLLWETPHYSASAANYRQISRTFDSFNDRLMAAELSGTQQIFPYPVKLDEYPVQIVPENLGYLDFKNPDPQQLLENSRNMLTVRDGLASFFFHPFIPLKHLKTVINGMRQQGWTFISARDFGCNLRSASRWVTSTSGEGTITLSNQYRHELLLNRQGKTVREEYSPDRSEGQVTKSIDIPPGSLYLLEGVDVLPAKKETGLVPFFRRLLAKWFPAKSGMPFQLTRALVLAVAHTSAEEELNQKSYFSVLKVFGFVPQWADLNEFKRLNFNHFRLLVVPNAVAVTLDRSMTNRIIDFMEKGGLVISDRRSLLAEQCGLRFDNRTIEVSQVSELAIPASDLTWNPAAVFTPFHSDEALILSRDAISGFPLAVAKTLGRGKFLFFGVAFDPFNAFGVSRFPYLAHYLRNNLDIPFNTQRVRLEFYFDPGLRQNTSWEKLVRLWTQSGIKIVYLATWHFYRHYRFNYKYFIKLCHSQGIAVYAWFVFPQVTPWIWEQHPEWREKNASGQDARAGWRRPLNLFHPQARAKAREWLWQVMTDFDWDGINLTELNFDTNRGTRDDSQFTPLNQEVRAAFRKRAGFDPQQLFLPASPQHWKKNRHGLFSFLNFRSELVKELHIFFLDEIEKIKKSKSNDMEVIVTALDSLFHPEIIEECGVNSKDILALMQRYSFTLQVEDPAVAWVRTPSRYLNYFQSYKWFIKDPARLMFDVNIVNRKDFLTRHLPSPIPTGSELATTFYYAALPTGRVGLYCEATINPFDLNILSFVTAADVHFEESGREMSIASDRSIILNLSQSGYRPILDDHNWPFYQERRVMIPPGRHGFRFTKTKLLEFHFLLPHILFDGDISALAFSGNQLSVNYRSPTPVFLSFNQPLENIALDGHVVDSSAAEAGLILPRGDHQLKIRLPSQPQRTLSIVGYLSASLFFWVGLLSISLLMAVYLSVKIKK